ncbi:YwmB family TATA-box binding protein [Bacillus tianshenii]|nr:YwmB family TATA-box binding protein [Bacillus tianshenii]
MHNTYLIYEMSGESLGEQEWGLITHETDEMSSNLFQKTPSFYSCVKGQAGGMMEGVLHSYAKRILNHVSARPIERVEENGFISISAYSNDLSQMISVENEKMNVQLGLRKQGLGGVISVTIGTPIITLEY